ncbi:hypothetical protein JNJ66_06910 [Candidatus Saccharibacteria bacterium]|nr:hypothetical protein [Candidatus Saccharibacteria bacterium]
MKSKLIITTLQSTFLLVAVLLNAFHAKDIVKPQLFPAKDLVKIHADDVMAKSLADLHNHIDKQTVKNMMHQGDGQQTDGRSLRLLREASSAPRQLRLEFEVAFGLWLRLVAAKLML